MIDCRKLTKRYGKTVALDGLDLFVGQGELHGFVGPNGAGKTTAMRILSTLLRPDSGDALVDGISVVSDPGKVRAQVGYMPDFFGVYDNLKVWEYLDLYAGCLRMGEKERRKRIDELLALIALTDKREAFVDGLSRGMKQRLCLARALIHDPQLLILDEPASGMDPRARAEMRDILTEIGQMGKTVLISSHILPELSQMCSSMSILERGKLIFSGTVEALETKMHAHAELIVRFAQPPEGESAQEARETVQAVCDALPDEREPGVWRMDMPESDEGDARLLAKLMALGLPVCEFKREKVTLEQVFMEVTRE
ncbi:MAG: ABC transporter ATP-binding protein [Clostridia bacterium]|nr:ABC transporter ATP-binding protein [Clostridia bacterium]